jgi:hypothetical protein
MLPCSPKLNNFPDEANLRARNDQPEIAAIRISRRGRYAITPEKCFRDQFLWTDGMYGAGSVFPICSAL